MTQYTWSRLVTFVYLKFTQMLILKVVSNNSINGLQCYSYKMWIRPCYGWDTSNGSWGLFWVFFWTCPTKTTPCRTLQAFALWHQKKATQSVLKLFSEIIDAQCLIDTSQVFDLHGNRCPHTFPRDPSLKLVQLHHIFFFYIARETSIPSRQEQQSAFSGQEFWLLCFFRMVYSLTAFNRANSLVSCTILSLRSCKFNSSVSRPSWDALKRSPAVTLFLPSNISPRRILPSS